MDPEVVEVALADRAAAVHSDLEARWGQVPHSTRTIDASGYEYPVSPDDAFRFAAVCFVLDEHPVARRRERRVLVCRDQKHDALEWEPPGGKAQSDEEPAETAVREVREETGIEAAVCDLLATELLRFDHGHAVMPVQQGVFLAIRTGGTIDPEPGIEPQWFPPADLPGETQYHEHLLQTVQDR